MLIKLTNNKGKTFWVNPLFIKGIREHKPGIVDVMTPVGSWSGLSGTIRVEGDAQEIADTVSAAMLALSTTSAGAIAAIADDEDQQKQAAAAAAAAG